MAKKRKRPRMTKSRLAKVNRRRPRPVTDADVAMIDAEPLPLRPADHDVFNDDGYDDDTTEQYKQIRAINAGLMAEDEDVLDTLAARL